MLFVPVWLACLLVSGINSQISDSVDCKNMKCDDNRPLVSASLAFPHCFKGPQWQELKKTWPVPPKRNWRPILPFSMWASSRIVTATTAILLSELMGYDVLLTTNENIGTYNLPMECCSNLPYVNFEVFIDLYTTTRTNNVVYRPTGYTTYSGLFIPNSTAIRYPMATAWTSYRYLNSYQHIFPQAFTTNMTDREISQACKDMNDYWGTTAPKCVKGRYVPPQCEGDQNCQEIYHRSPAWDSGYFESLINNTKLKFTFAYLQDRFVDTVVEASRLGNPIVFYWFWPDPLISKLEAQEILFRPYTMGCAARNSINPTLNSNDCGFPIQQTQKAIHTTYLEKDPDFKHFFESVILLEDYMAFAMAQAANSTGSWEDPNDFTSAFSVSCDWLRGNTAVWTKWIQNTPTAGVDYQNSNYDSQWTIWIILGVFGFCVLIASPFAWRYSEHYRKMRKLLDNEKVAIELAESVAIMDFASVEYLKSIVSPTRIQSAFIKIVDNLQQFKSYMPKTLFASNQPENDSDAFVQCISVPRISSEHRQSILLENPEDIRTDMDPSRPSSWGSLNGVKDRLFTERVSILVTNIRHTHLHMYESSFVASYVNSMKAITRVLDENRGVPILAMGDRLTISFNAPSRCPAKAFNVCRSMVSISTFLEALDNKESFVSMGASMGIARCGDLGIPGLRTFTVLSPCVLEASELQVRHSAIMDTLTEEHSTVVEDNKIVRGMISGSIFEEVQANFYGRIDCVIASPKYQCNEKNDGHLICVRLIHEIDVNADTEEEEAWMYAYDEKGPVLEYNQSILSMVSSRNIEVGEDFVEKYKSTTSPKKHLSLVLGMQAVVQQMKSIINT
eukprot:PhF_6_TR23299/c0_g1_i1/m.32877